MVDRVAVTVNASSRTPSWDQPVLVIYDGGCPLCVILADFSRKKMAHVTGVGFAASAESNPRELEVQISDDASVRKLSGKEAWSWLLENHPSLREIHWLASKLGLTSEVSAVMKRGTEFLRTFCLRCR
jgi:hypothetical protein